MSGRKKVNVNVIILKAGKYLDIKLKAHKCAVGDVLDTTPWYAEVMEKNGQAKRKETAKATIKPKTVTKTPGARPVNANTGKNKAAQVPLPANTFLGEGAGVPQRGKGGKTSPQPVEATSPQPSPEGEGVEAEEGEDPSTGSGDGAPEGEAEDAE
jgi:hypothetical protein